MRQYGISVKWPTGNLEWSFLLSGYITRAMTRTFLDTHPIQTLT